MDQPRAVLVVISVVSLIVMAAATYVALVASASAPHETAAPAATAARAETSASSPCASATVRPGASRPITHRYAELRASSRSGAKGTHSSAVSGNFTPRGITPITVWGTPSSSRENPMGFGFPALSAVPAGVIRITTKQGASGKATFSAHADYGATWDPNDYPVRAWNANVDLGSQYKDTTYYINSLKGDISSPDADLYYNPFRTASTGKLGISMRGGSENLSYYTSADWNSQGGVFPTNSQKSYNLRGNFTIRPRENLSVALSTGYRSSNTAFNYNDGESWGYIGAVTLGQPMWTPIIASDPNGGGAAIETCPRALEEALEIAGAPMRGGTLSPAPSRAGSTSGARCYD